MSDPIPLTPDTLPDPQVVDFVRYALRKHVEAQNEREYLGLLQRAIDRLDTGPEAA